MWMVTAIAAPIWAGDWSQFRSGPYEVYTDAGNRARETLLRLEQFRHAGSVEHFDYVVAEGKDSLTGDREVVDLLKERFISHVEVDADAFNDPAKSVAQAVSILNKQARDNEEFFARTLPEVRGSPDTALVPDLIAGGMAAVREAMAAALAVKEAASADVPTPSVKADSREGGAGHELVRG